tara:strand:+ start:7088 stop:8101 length:1014 start_codon:yes stop_codon:yes gene_type:complete
MSTNKYFEMMTETSAAADPIIKEYVEGIVNSARGLPLRRTGRPRLKDLAIRLGYEISGGYDWREVVPLSASYELLNCSTYVINWILDEKGGRKSKNESDGLIIGGFQLREAAEQVLRDYGMGSLAGTISKINGLVYDGQRLDLNVLNVGNIGDFVSLEDFLKVYEERCLGLSGAVYGHCLQSGSSLAGIEDPRLYEIGCLQGMGGQASNDFGDFAMPDEGLTVMEKPYKDQFSDLKQGKLTLPVYLLMTKGSPEDRKLIENIIGKEEIDKEDFEVVNHLLHETGTFSDCYNYLKSKKRNAREKLYGGFDRSLARDMLAEMQVMIVSNKFIKRLRESS